MPKVPGEKDPVIAMQNSIFRYSRSKVEKQMSVKRQNPLAKIENLVSEGHDWLKKKKKNMITKNMKTRCKC